MKAMMMVESGMDRHIATSPPSNGIATEHLHQRHHPDANGATEAHHGGTLLVNEDDVDDATSGGSAKTARSPRSQSGGVANHHGNPFLATLFLACDEGEPGGGLRAPTKASSGRGESIVAWPPGCAAAVSAGSPSTASSCKISSSSAVKPVFSTGVPPVSSACLL